MKSIKLTGICLLASTLALSGCVARTYEMTRDRVDQELTPSFGNRGYIMGNAPEPKDRKTTRTTRVFEVELGPKSKTNAPCPSATPLAPAGTEEPMMIQESQSSPVQTEELSGNFQTYKVAKNDTLQKISKKFYGTTKRWTKIYEANKDVLRGPDKLYPGQVLKIPEGRMVNTESSKMLEPKENLK